MHSNFFQRNIQEYQGAFSMKEETLHISLRSMKEGCLLVAQYAQDNMPSNLANVINTPQELFDIIDKISSSDLKVSPKDELVICLQMFNKLRQFPIPLQKSSSLGEAKLKQQNETLRKTINDLQLKMYQLQSDSEQNLTALRKQIRMLEIEVQQTKNKYAQTKKQCQHLELDLKQASKAKNIASNSGLEAELQKQQVQNNEMKCLLQQLQAQMHYRQAQTQEQKYQEKKTIQHLNCQINMLHSQIDHLIMNLDQVQCESSMLKKINCDLTDKCKRLQCQLQDAISSKQTAPGCCGPDTSDKNSLLKEQERMKDRCQELQQKTAYLQQELQSMKYQLISSQSIHSKQKLMLEELLKQSKQKIDHLRQQLNSKDIKADSATMTQSNQISFLQKQIQRLTDIIQLKEQEAQIYRQQANLVTAAPTEPKKEKLEAQLLQCRKSLEQQMMRNQELQQVVAMLKMKLNSCHMKMQALKQQLTCQLKSKGS